MCFRGFSFSELPAQMRTFIHEVGFFLCLCFPEESRVRPLGSEVTGVDLSSGRHWPGAPFHLAGGIQVHRRLLTRSLVLDPAGGRSRSKPIPRARGPRRWVGGLREDPAHGGVSGIGVRRGGVVGCSGKVPLLWPRARNSDAALRSVGPGMLMECSQRRGQTLAEAGVLSIGAELRSSSGSAGETEELGSEVGGSGDCGEAGLLASNIERWWKRNCFCNSVMETQLCRDFPVTFPSLPGKDERSEQTAGAAEGGGCRPLPTEDFGWLAAFESPEDDLT